LCLFSLNVKKPSTEELTAYYAKAVMTKPMKWFCRQSAKNKFSEYAKRTMEETASKKYADRCPYSWKMDYYEYAGGSG